MFAKGLSGIGYVHCSVVNSKWLNTLPFHFYITTLCCVFVYILKFTKVQL